MSIKTGDILNFAYTGSVQSIELPKGIYKLECWGAQGGDSLSNTAVGGKGGYSIGQLTLTNKILVYIYSGGAGLIGVGSSIQSGGFNGGGNGAYNGAGSGGGASDIRIGQDNLYARLIVAGAGGGAGYYDSDEKGGAGGGTSGLKGGGYSSTYNHGGGPGTQTSGGATDGSSYDGYAGEFGIGGNANQRESSYSRSGGGGAGWYGGGGAGVYNSSSNYKRYVGGGGGGSGYVYTEATAANYPFGCLLTSAYYLTDAQTIAGDQSFASPDGAAETGHAGDGYVRITAIDAESLSMPVKINGVWKNSDAAFVKINGIWKPVESVYTKINGIWKPNS